MSRSDADSGKSTQIMFETETHSLFLIISTIVTGAQDLIKVGSEVLARVCLYVYMSVLVTVC